MIKPKWFLPVACVIISGNEKAPSDCQWFSINEIRDMAKAGQIAFGNDKILEEFAEWKKLN